MVAPEPGRLALAPHAVSSMVFSCLHGGLYIDRDLGLVPDCASGFYLQFATFSPLSDMRNVISLLPPLVAITYFLPGFLFSLLPTKSDAAFPLALTLLLLTEAHSTFRY